MSASSRFFRRPSLWTGSLALSLLLHLVGLYLVQDFQVERMAPQAFRVRLALYSPRFEPPRPAIGGGPGGGGPEVKMEQLAPPLGSPQGLPEGVLQSLLPSLPPLAGEGLRAPTSLGGEVGTGAKSAIPLIGQGERATSLAPGEMPRPSELGLAAEMKLPSMELLRLVDLARANKEHALVIPSRISRRDLLGYINFTRLRVHGAGGTGAGLDALARYLNDYTGLLARVRDQGYDYFLSEELLKDPIHFLIQGNGLPTYGERALTYFSPEEKRLLREYLRGGGFLYIEGGNRFLREMAGHLKEILGKEGRLYPLPPTHGIYHSFYDFNGGFPGEDKTRFYASSMSPGWDYPISPRGNELTSDPGQSALSQFAQEEEEAEAEQPLGLWGVEMGDRLVAVLSDLYLFQHWATSFADNPNLAPSRPGLMAGANIAIYALTRQGGLTSKEERPPWLHDRPPTPLQLAQQTGSTIRREEAELMADLDASLAVIQAPLGRRLAGRGLEVQLDGRYSLEVFDENLHGLLLHNLPPGRHWLEVQYGGKRRQLEIELEGGKVLTVTFGLNRFAFLSQLHLGQEKVQVFLDQWLSTFSDLQVEEMHLGEDRRLLESKDQK